MTTKMTMTTRTTTTPTTNNPTVAIDMVPVKDDAGRIIYAPGAPSYSVPPSAMAEADAYCRGAADGLKAGMGIVAVLGLAMWLVSQNPKPKRRNK